TAGRPDSDGRFRDAITSARGLDHPHLVPVLRSGETDSLLWYTMEHRRGRPLREIVRTTGPMDLKIALRLLTQIAAALDYLHRRGAIHGRLKPDNVLADADNWVFVCDAMIARAFHATPATPPAPPAIPPRTSGAESAPRRPSGATFTPRISDPRTGRRSSGASSMPTPPAATPGRNPYGAPEESTGLLGAASDQYALGAILYTLLAGAPPEPTADGRTILPLGALRPNLPPHIEQAVARALSERPNDRFPAVLDFVTALESGATMMRDARPSGRASDLILTIPDWEPPETPMTRWKKPATIGGIAALAIGIVAVVVTMSGPPADHGFQMLPPPPPVTPQVHDSTPSTTLTPTPSGSLRISAPAQVRLGAEPLGVMQSDSRSRRTGQSNRSGRRDSTPASPTSAPASAPSSAPSAAPSAAPSSAPAAGGGTLFVNASPWGQLYIDGQLVGNTPKANLAVSAGPHTIRVQREGFNPAERSVRVGAGETVRVTDLVLTPHQ
ncbi:MAG TPA: serine/threonine-protein kinase, partial [Gemmatimonadales bacterium]